MLSFSGFRLEDGSPIYQQIIRYLEQGIAAGTIRDGDGLPSRRVLSAQLGVNPNTVQKACRMLEEAGLITSRSGAKSEFTLDEAAVAAVRTRLMEREAAALVRSLRQMGLTSTRGGGAASTGCGTARNWRRRSHEAYRIPAHAGRTEHPLESCGDYSGLLSDGSGTLPGCPVRLAGHRPHRLLRILQPHGPGGPADAISPVLVLPYRAGAGVRRAGLSGVGRFLPGELYPAAAVSGAQGPHPAVGRLRLLLPAVLLGGPPGHPAGPLCRRRLPRLAPEFSGPQALFLACYRDSYLHSLLPLDDCLLWVRNLSMCAALGTAAASFSFQRRMGRRAFAVLPLAALSALCFPLPMGSFEFGGPAEFLRPYLYDGIFYPRTVCPLSWGPSCFLSACAPWPPPLCQILRRDPYEE
ncbi:MAG: GntR family transcriptional regulator [Flavonifractor plautii]